MILDIPQIPFNVYDITLQKTIHVVSSCNQREHSAIVLVDDKTESIAAQVFATIKLAFKTNGITYIEVCRIKKVKRY